jgi:hypothetical protein
MVLKQDSGHLKNGRNEWFKVLVISHKSSSSTIVAKTKNFRAFLKIARGAVFEQRAGWRVVPIIGRDEGEYPSWVFDRGATKPGGSLLENPSAVAKAMADKPGGGSFACGPRRLGRHPDESGLRTNTFLAALPTARIPGTPRDFQTGSKPEPCS